MRKVRTNRRPSFSSTDGLLAFFSCPRAITRLLLSAVILLTRSAWEVNHRCMPVSKVRAEISAVAESIHKTHLGTLTNGIPIEAIYFMATQYLQSFAFLLICCRVALGVVLFNSPDDLPQGVEYDFVVVGGALYFFLKRSR